MKNYLENKFDLAEFADFYDEVPLWSAPFGLKLLEQVEYRKGIKALDIGFGAGFPLTELAMRLGDSSVVYGIDPWKEATERARKKIRFYGIQNIEIIEGFAESIPLPDHSIDLVVSNNGLNNVSDLEKALSECSRVMKKGGQFIQTMNTEGTMMEFYSGLEKVLSEMHLHEEIEAMHQHIHEKRRPLDEFIPMIQGHGFTVMEIIHDEFAYRFTDATAMFNHYFIRLAFMDSWIRILPEDRVDEIFDRVESRLNEKVGLAGGMKLSIPFVIIDCKK